MSERHNRRKGDADHEEFVALCALAVSGNLTDEEQAKLREHLHICPECREAMKEFESVATEVISEFEPQAGDQSPAASEFSQEKAAASFRRRLAEERENESKHRTASFRVSQPPSSQSRGAFHFFDRYDLWLPLAASLLLCATLGILSYRTGRNHGIVWAKAEWGGNETQTAMNERPVVTMHSDDLSTDEEAKGDAVLAQLRREIEQKSAELARLKEQRAKDDLRLQASAEDKKELNEERSKLVGERDSLLRQASAEQATLRDAQDRLKALENARTEDLMRAASLETKIAELSNALEERDRLTADQQDLLAKDKDIRELIGARDLYITEIYDVAHNGDTRKATGRVFYTKGKSLIFYAYDLKDNRGADEASTFEAWGQRGPDWHQAQRLGLFYEDNVSKKRWVAKSNDKKTLDQIDAVFITVEPNGGSERPTGKPLLFTYLKVAPNHP